ncbi:MAG: iron chelate uptake ABC transporter family permease subunit [Thermoplasmata archaeon]|nr:iron chelate uptake ABC transporter family permease subunit [Thermoplasmata archaeon]
MDSLSKRGRTLLVFVLLTIALILSIVFALMVGSLGPIGRGMPYLMSFEAFFDVLTGGAGKWANGTLFSTVIFEIRMPRILLSAVVGGGLAVAGALMQGLFKNPMADPFILGTSSGAALGASFVILFGFGVAASLYSLPLLAFLGAVVTSFVVYGIARVGGRVQTRTLLLSGIAVGSFLSAIVTFLLFIKQEQFKSLFFWLLGSFSMAERWEYFLIAFPIIMLAMIASLAFSRDLNIMLLGEDSAHTLGVNPEMLKKIILVITSVLVGVCVAFTGIIGFVGLIIPHVVRILMGPNHSYLIPASFLTGAIFLLWADTLARSIIAPTELPIGIITAFCGAPFFIYLLRRGKA